jgi:Na+-driven multidrug efflux pump
MNRCAGLSLELYWKMSLPLIFMPTLQTLIGFVDLIVGSLLTGLGP